MITVLLFWEHLMKMQEINAKCLNVKQNSSYSVKLPK